MVLDCIDSRSLHPYLDKQKKLCKIVNIFVPMIFWGELIDKYIDINANSKTVFTDYAMLKLVLYSPHMFL